MEKQSYFLTIDMLAERIRTQRSNDVVIFEGVEKKWKNFKEKIVRGETVGVKKMDGRKKIMW